MSFFHGFAVTLLVLAQAAPARHWVIRRDGTGVELRAAPARRGNAWVGTLLDGQLVSIPVAEVDEGKTLEANRSGIGVVPTPTPTFTPTIRLPGSKVPLGDKVKLSVTAGEAQKKLESARVIPTLKPGEKEPPKDAPLSPRAQKEKADKAAIDRLKAEAAEKAAPEKPEETPAGKPAAKPERKDDGPGSVEHKDSSGRGEAYWRDRAGKALGELEQAKGAARKAEAALANHESQAPRGQTEAAQGSWAGTLQKLRNDVTAAQQREAKAQGAMDALREEARKANAYPGWLR